MTYKKSHANFIQQSIGGEIGKGENLVSIQIRNMGGSTILVNNSYPIVPGETWVNTQQPGTIDDTRYVISFDDLTKFSLAKITLVNLKS